MDKYMIIAMLFLSSIGVVSTKTVVDNKDALIEAIVSGDRIENINYVYNENIAFKEEFLSIWSETQEKMGAELLDDAEYGHIIKDNTGNLYFPAKDTNIEKYANSTIQFSNKLADKNIPFCYVQAPNKMIEGYTSNTVYNYNFSNKNATEFLDIISKNGVNTLDLRNILSTSGIPQDKMFYKTDHHWTTPTAFWATKTLANFLNEKDGLNIPVEYLSDEKYNKIEKRECFLGSLGRRVGASVAGYDDYIFIEPTFETNYEVINGITNELVGSGNFHNAIVKEHILNSNDYEVNKHATYFEWDYGDLIIKNKMVNNDIKLLLIKDSYSLPLVAFLSTCVSELEMVDLRDKPKADLKQIIDSKDFDAVVVIYNTEVFDDRMFSFDY